MARSNSTPRRTRSHTPEEETQARVQFLAAVLRVLIRTQDELVAARVAQAVEAHLQPHLGPRALGALPLVVLAALRQPEGRPAPPRASAAFPTFFAASPAEVRTCSRCGELIPPGTLHGFAGGGTLCSRCFSRTMPEVA